MITFERVSKRYPDGSLAVEDFSLHVPTGHIVSLVGSSGSGKTTLLRMVNRMAEPTAGRVLVSGADVRSRPAVQLRRGIGYVLQSGGLLPHKTVVDNIAAVPRLTGVPRPQARLRAEELMEKMGLDPSLSRRYPHQLSGGQQQRVGVARALAADPAIVLMDEPFGAVDPIVRRELQEQLLRLQADLNKTILLVTHDMDEALRLSNTVVILDKPGRIVRQGSPAEILARPGSDFVRRFLGTAASNTRLTVHDVEGSRVVTDPQGIPVGVLEA
ncbi:ABC transporter ATP-binding protein [Corynebacterium oculi]|uniref:ABC-type quaternary amine transporter n=1 Tax=Corynebacterium oculi TaxID=1544416 RepID=A0A0Q0YL54_9CORY|nr:ATP-binding cassette domain-containing protein [Corynebacterium oculi]KQB83199.1 Choline transport ATP-binding protein OpuBA [Corynebacterium oculi]